MLQRNEVIEILRKLEGATAFTIGGAVSRLKGWLPACDIEDATVVYYGADGQCITKRDVFKTVVITGSFVNYTRAEVKDALIKHGHTVNASVSRKTDALICGSDAGAKLDKALELGITVYNEQYVDKIIDPAFSYEGVTMKLSEWLKHGWTADTLREYGARVGGSKPSDVVSDLSNFGKKHRSKYDRDCKGVTIDVYDVLKAFEVVDPALQHLIKKALCAGLRGHKNRETDLNDILESAKRAVELNK